MRKIILLLSMLAATVMLFQSCKTKEGTPTGLGKAYHNVTGRYNAYYNAEMRLDKSFETLNDQHRDNYNQLLEMYPYAAVDNASSVAAPLDEAIKKASKNIILHEPSIWLDDSYLLMGQSEFLKKEYDKSSATFKYIVDKFNPNKAKSAMTPEELAELKAAEKKARQKNRKKKKRKKKKRKKRKKKKPTPKDKDKDKDADEETDEETKIKYGIKHRPNRLEAMLWLAKSYIEEGNYNDARLYLRLLSENPNMRKRLVGEVYAVWAYSFIKQKEYEKAIEPLEQAVELVRKRKDRSRYAYVLAQLYQKRGDSELAMQTFKQVLKLRPEYEMEFNARLNMAKNAANVKGRKTVNPEMAVRRMLRDGKNEEYKDQLYFALAEIKLKAGNEEEGIIALKQSMAQSSGGPQRGEAALLLADLYYGKEDYVAAYYYYDTTSSSLQKADERLLAVNAKKIQLKGIAENTEIIVLQDSLLSVGKLSEADQKAWAQRMRQMEHDQKMAQKPGAGGKKGGAMGMARPNSSVAGGASSNLINQSQFELYNPNMRKKGEKEFSKRWGNRAWADNWRRSNMSDEVNDRDVASVGGTLPPMTNDEVSKFMKKKKIPTTEAQQKNAKGEIATAYFRLGINYREQLQNDEKAAEAFETLLDEYPGTKHELEALYMLYDIYNSKGNASKANAYKMRIIAKHPDSDIAKAIKDPNFVGAKQKQILELNEYYDDVQTMIASRKFDDARTKIKAVPTKFGQNYELKARFAILDAMCVGGVEGKKQYIQALRAVVASYPKTPEEAQAKAMLAVLQDGKGNTNNTPKPNNGAKATFSNSLASGHYILIVFDDPKAKVSNYKGSVSDFNKENYSLKRLSVSVLLLDRKIPSIVVRKFKTGQEAKDYRNTALANTDFMKNAPDYQIYYINQNNYRTVLQKNIFGQYTQFFKDELDD